MNEARPGQAGDVQRARQQRFLGCEDSPGGEMATHSSILARIIPQTKKPGGLQSMGSQRVRHDCACVHTRTHTVI